eukprot:3609100-Pyramimonas_sp.AAC.1
MQGGRSPCARTLAKPALTENINIENDRRLCVAAQAQLRTGTGRGFGRKSICHNSNGAACAGTAFLFFEQTRCPKMGE